MGHLHLKAYPRSPFREEGGNPHRQEILVKCSDKKGGGRDLENLGESLGGIRRVGRVRQVGQIRRVRRVRWRECCFEKEGKLARWARAASLRQR